MTTSAAKRKKEPTPPKTQDEEFIREVLGKALHAPGFAYISAVFGIIVLVAAASRFGLSLATLALGAIGAIILATLYSVFSRATRESKGRTSTVGVLFVWTITVLFLVTLCLIFWSAFFNAPLPLRNLVLLKLGSPDNEAAVTEDRTLKAIRTEPVARRITEVVVSETNTPPGVPTNTIVKFLRDQRPGVGYHYIVDRKGYVYPYVDTDSAIAHTPRHNAQSVAIGLEHTGGEEYSPAQINGLKKLLASLVDRFNISPGSIYSKQELDPRRPRDITRHMHEIRTELRR
jgi:hypothetical protein